MKLKLLILLSFVPNILWSQFDDKEMYLYSRLNVSIGMRDFGYASIIDDASFEIPLITQLKLSSGITLESGVGFMILKHFFIEGNLGYSILHKNGYKSSSEYYVDTYSFNRAKIGVNGLYFVEIDENNSLFATIGVKAIIPQCLKITSSQDFESLRYNASVAFTTGFGGNFHYNNFVYGVGLHFNMENYTLSPDQELPPHFLELNSSFKKLKLRNMVLNVTIKWLF